MTNSTFPSGNSSPVSVASTKYGAVRTRRSLKRETPFTAVMVSRSRLDRTAWKGWMSLTRPAVMCGASISSKHRDRDTRLVAELGDAAVAGVEERVLLGGVGERIVADVEIANLLAEGAVGRWYCRVPRSTDARRAERPAT